MRKQRITWLLLAILTYVSPCFAQDGDIAFIDSTAFFHPQTGIKRLVNTVSHVDQQFAPRRAELVTLHEKLQRRLEKLSFSGPIPTDPRPMTKERRKALKGRIEVMQRSFEHKQEEVQREHDERMKEATAPIFKDIQTSLEELAKSRGIKTLLDASKTPCCAGDCSEKSR